MLEVSNEFPKERATPFRACTLKAKNPLFLKSIIRRQRLENLMDLRDTGGGNIVISGPAGSGKSILAIQTALGKLQSCQYIGARRLPFPMLPNTENPKEISGAIAQIANRIVHQPASGSNRSLQLLFDNLHRLDGKGTDVVIFDDVDILIDRTSREMLEIAATGFSRLNHTLVIWVTRSGIGSLSDFLNDRTPSRMILPSLITITPREMSALIEAGSFGDYSEQSIRKSFDSMGGWFVGIRRHLDVERFGDSALDDYVFNEIVLGSPVSLQTALGTLIDLPFISHEILGFLLAELGEKSTAASSALSRLPLIPEGLTTTGTTRYRLPDSLAASLRRVLPQLGREVKSKALTVQALNWMLSTGEHEISGVPDIAADLGNVLVGSAKRECSILAAEEQWIKIHDSLSKLPEVLVFGDTDLAFWYMKGCSYLGEWDTVTRIRHAVQGKWEESDDPLERGRALIIDSWRNWTQSQPEASLEKASLAYDTIPESKHQDRLWAAIQAENAARNLGLIEMIDYWSVRTGGLGTRMTTSPEFWHMNCGFHRLNHLALTGKLEHAFRLSGNLMVQTPSNFPHASFRYPLLQAYVEMERGNLESARQCLESAEGLAQTQPFKQQLVQANAAYHLAAGDSVVARTLLERAIDSSATRPDFHLFRVRLLVEAYLASGEIELAQSTFANLVGGNESWPKYFGEPHHHLLSSRLNLMLGEADMAFEIAQFVVNESARRGHLFYLIEAQAIQAECLHSLGRSARRDSKIAASIKSDNGEGAIRSLSPLGRHLRELAPLTISESSDRPRTHSQPFAGDLKGLTPREWEILEAVAQGSTTRRIAEIFYISQNTVKNHLSSIFRKLEVNSRKEAISIAFPLKESTQVRRKKRTK